MEDRKFELDGHIEEENPEQIEVNPSSRVIGIYILLVVFIILFLTSASMFVYFQFYQGKGKWHFSLEKNLVDLSLTDSVVKENTSLKARLDSLQLLVEKNTAVDQELFPTDTLGEMYEVQIGFFRSYDFEGYEDKLINMNTETENGATKLRIGRFTTFEEACKFRKDIIDLGIKGAFIVKKVDGQRVPFDAICP